MEEIGALKICFLLDFALTLLNFHVKFNDMIRSLFKAGKGVVGGD